LKFITSNPGAIQVGDILSVSFTLDNARKSNIKRQVQVRHVNNDHVGVEFVNPPPYDKDLGFYLR
jgi:hypothetical protein